MYELGPNMNPDLVKSLILSEDMASAYVFVKAHADEGKVSLLDADTDASIGILLQAGKEGDVREVALPGAGLCPIQYGDTVSQFQELAAAADGQAVPATSGKKVLGLAGGDGVADQVGTILFIPQSANATGDAKDIAVTDAYANYAGDDVEACLAEIGGAAYTNRFAVSVTLDGAAAATAANYGKFFIAPRACVVKRITEVHTTAGNDADAVTLNVERLQGTEVSGAGDALLSAAFDLKGTAETVQVGTLTTTTAHLALAAGDRLNLVDTGTLTTLAGVCVTVELEYTVADNS